MSIFIKGINIPKEPWDCPCHDGENGNCKVTGHSCYDIPKDCPLVEVPTPHGDLIDRDKLGTYFQLVNGFGDVVGMRHAISISEVEKAPTVIESED